MSTLNRLIFFVFSFCALHGPLASHDVFHSNSLGKQIKTMSACGLAVKLNNVINQYGFTRAPDRYQEQFTFTTDRQQKYLIINQHNPRKMRCTVFDVFPYHIGFGKVIVKRDQGVHKWTVRTNKTSDHIILGIYFNTYSDTFKTDFGKDVMPLGAETYLSKSCQAIAGVIYSSGETFGGDRKYRFGKIPKGDVTLILDSHSDTLTIHAKSKSYSFVVSGLRLLRKYHVNWEAVFWVSMGSGGFHLDHEAEIVHYSKNTKAGQ